MTPAEELRTAAAKLREMAGAATAGPWTTGPEISGLKDVYGSNGAHVAGGDWPVAALADAEWIALMGPDRAELLACWLDVTARVTEFELRMSGMAEALSVEQRAARDFARSILEGTR